MPPEANPNGAPAQAAQESTFDAGEWFQTAGLDPAEVDPQSVAEALQFRSEWEGKTPLDEGAVMERARELSAQQWQDPDYYRRAEQFFRNQFDREQKLKIDDKTEVTPQKLQELAAAFRQEQDERFKAFSASFGTLDARQKQAAEKERLEKWAQGFERQLDEAAKRGNPGIVDNDWLKQQVRFRFTSGMIRDDKPATIRAIVKGIIAEEAQRAQGYLDRTGATKLLAREQPALDASMPLKDAIKDDDTRQRLVSRILSNGL
jgi:hypothetical protein